jgi:sec-independent protein translocase protein TatC
MADEPVAEHLDVQPEEEEGGPVKSFLEHLEDLRWVLIKSAVAAGVAMLACLLGGNYVVRVLERPLHRAPQLHSSKAQTVRVLFGTNELSVLHVTTNDPIASLIGTNPAVRLELVPTFQGDKPVLSWRASPDAEGATSRGLPIQIINLSPAGSFIVATKAAFYGGLVLASPFIFYFVAQFVFPALRMREKKYVYRGLAFGAGLFMIGVCFCYFILLPVALAASVQYAEWLGFTANQWRAEDYVAFVCKFMLGMGIGFELPVVVLTLVKMGILSYRALAAGRPYVIVISALLGAILTTPEVITQILMAVPLYLLYEICIWVSWYWERQEKKREAAEAAGDTLRET